MIPQATLERAHEHQRLTTETTRQHSAAVLFAHRGPFASQYLRGIPAAECFFSIGCCSWFLGGARGPLSPSIEAPNAFGWVMQPDETRSLLYHTPFTGGEDQVNLGVVAWCLNWVHGHHPIAVMPFVGRILRATTDFEDPASQRREIELWRWFTLVVGIRRRTYVRHQMASLDEHNATLHALCTADRSPYVADRLDLFTDRQLFRFRDLRDCH